MDEDEDTFESRYLEQHAGGGHEPIKKDVYLVESIIDACRSHLGERLLLVKWLGWKHPTWEPREQISPVVLDAYDHGKAYGVAAYPSMLADPSAAILELSALEMEMYAGKKGGKSGKCATFKAEQKRWSKVRPHLSCYG